MRVVTDPTIQGMSGRFPKSRLVMNHRDGKTITHARSYIRPVNVEGQAAFAEKLAAVVGTYKAANALFVADLKTYVDAYNDQIVDDHELPISKYSLFVKGVFAAAKENSFDVTTLTCALFGGTAGDLLGTEVADVYHLISVALMPGLGFEAADLSANIEVV